MQETMQPEINDQTTEVKHAEVKLNKQEILTSYWTSLQPVYTAYNISNIST